MKSILQIALFLSSILFSNAQPLLWDWGKKITTSPFGYFNSGIASDVNADIYTTGVSNDVLFVTKYNTYGNVLWERRMDSAILINDGVVCVDALGNVYVACTFLHHIHLDNKTITASDSDMYNLLIAKYDVNGTLLWAGSAGSDAVVIVNAIAADSVGNVYVTGGFNGSRFCFGTDTLKNAFSPEEVGFLIKYSYDGNTEWFHKLGTKNAMVTGLTVDPQGSVCVCGWYTDTLIVDSVIISTPFSFGEYVVKYNSNGKMQWSKNILKVGYNFLGQDIQHNYYFIGKYEEAIFDTVTLPNGPGLLMVKLKNNGEIIWIKKLDVDGIGNISAVCVHPDGKILIGGNFTETFRIGGKTIHSYAHGRYPRGYPAAPDIYLGYINADGSLLALDVIPCSKQGVSLTGMKLLYQDKIVISGIAYDSIYLGKNILPFGSFLAKTANLPTGAEEHLSPEINFNVYPNPVNNTFYISSSQPCKTIAIYNTAGQLIQTFNGNSDQNGYNISTFTSGVYVVGLQMENAVQYFKLIKQ